MQNLSELKQDRLSSDGLRERVQSYYEYAYPKKGNGGNVFLSTVIPRTVLEELLNTSDTGGIRLYLTKDSADDTQDDIRLLAVPVRSGSGTEFTDLLDAESKMYLTDCRDPYCPESFTPNQPNLLPDGFLPRA